MTGRTTARVITSQGQRERHEDSQREENERQRGRGRQRGRERESETQRETGGQDRQREGLTDIFIAARGLWRQIGREIEAVGGAKGEIERGAGGIVERAARREERG